MYIRQFYAQIFKVTLLIHKKNREDRFLTFLRSMEF